MELRGRKGKWEEMVETRGAEENGWKEWLEVRGGRKEAAEDSGK